MEVNGVSFIPREGRRRCVVCTHCGLGRALVRAVLIKMEQIEVTEAVMHGWLFLKTRS